MSDLSAKTWHLQDHPTPASVSRITNALRDQSAQGTVSPKSYAHRSRVVRQQTALLERNQAADSGQDTFVDRSNEIVPPPVEGGHMSCTTGLVVSTPHAAAAFKVIMRRDDGDTFELAFATAAEAEAFIRRNTPRPPERSKTYDHDSD